MEIVITSSPDGVAQLAADAVQRLVESTERPVLGLATGSSPLPTYRELIERHRNRRLSFEQTLAFLLDEYVGLRPGHPAAYRTFIEHEFTGHIDLPGGALYGPDGRSDDLAHESVAYEQQISTAGGIDLQLLGIGRDGHIGFNEPASSLGSRTRLKTLTDATRADNARFFGGDVDAVPRHVVTQGIGTILEAGHVLLLATGEQKAAPIALAIEGPITAMVPASALQLHPHTTVIIDEPAAQALGHAGYYREAFANKPGWQHI